MFWNREEVFMSFELEKYIKAKQILEDNKIEYKTKTNLPGVNRNTHKWGSNGVEQRYNTTYYIYTEKSAAGRARHLIRKELFT